ncbi:IclR family transcriptional regulator [Nocardia macrotermitis]|uniref:Glycerol operon regulatory protein n=1 Tax=Nocardia macrotermitis TaxID=2585198 RepID=A0A7K0DB55_9NOCA|nr:IclR family transcriptional regulator [Nocardia macrotermitis]MQY22751.1 Glycerol operon regulatory protein [Nocardia macrotermitis]
MPGPIQSIERAAAILRLLARGSGRLGVGDIAAALDLAKPTAHGILRTLQGVGFVEQEAATGKYRLGAAVRQLGAAVSDGSASEGPAWLRKLPPPGPPGTLQIDANELRSWSINWADSLASRSGEEVRVGVSTDGGVLVVHHVFRPDNSEQALQVGERLPAHATALGKVLLAAEPDLAHAVRRGELTSLTHRTLTDRGVLTRTLTEVRRSGWAGSVEEFRPGEAGIAAPIRARGGLVIGAIGIAGPVDRVCGAQLRHRPPLIALVRDAAHAISRDLAAGH